MSTQTSETLQRILSCHAALIEDLLTHNFDFVLTSKFQSDPNECRYGQYRRMSVRRSLVSLKDITSSENMLKIKSLVKKGMKITVKLTASHEIEIQEILENFEQSVLNASVISQLSNSSKEVSDYIAGYITVQMQDHVCDACWNRLDWKQI